MSDRTDDAITALEGFQTALSAWEGILNTLCHNTELSQDARALIRNLIADLPSLRDDAQIVIDVIESER